MPLRLIDLSDLAPSRLPPLGKCAAKFTASSLRLTGAEYLEFADANDEGNGTAAGWQLANRIWSPRVSARASRIMRDDQKVASITAYFAYAPYK